MLNTQLHDNVVEKDGQFMTNFNNIDTDNIAVHLSITKCLRYGKD